MKVLTRYSEEIVMGFIDDQEPDCPKTVVEVVTVCPSCRSFHSLRHEGGGIHCTECSWAVSVAESPQPKID